MRNKKELCTDEKCHFNRLAHYHTGEGVTYPPRQDAQPSPPTEENDA